MSMKRTDLAKSLRSKISGQMSQAAVPGRFGQAAGEVPDRREQRKLDQAAGLVPFAAKLHGDLVKELQALAAASGQSLNEVADRVIRAGLKQEVAAAQPMQPEQDKPKKATKPKAAKPPKES